MLRCFLLFLLLILLSSWGFFGHRKINRLAAFTLPVEMMVFYKKNIDYVEEAAVNADRRRYISDQEAPRHYIDIDRYGDSAFAKLPVYWNTAIAKFNEDSLNAHGILPWQIYRVYNQLRDAFAVRDSKRILSLSTDLGHYVADAHVPLHTTRNYDGQLTQQTGIHALWESRLPELFFAEYDFFVGKARYIPNVQQEVWHVIADTHACVDSVLVIERTLFQQIGERKYNFESKGRQTARVVAWAYAKDYHSTLNGMVERRMRKSILMIGSLWYSAWVDAGQPDLTALETYRPSEEELKQQAEEWKNWRREKTTVRGDTLHRQ